MTMKRMLVVFSLALLVIVVAILAWLLVLRVPTERRPATLLTTGLGVETTDFQLHESILVDAINLSPRTGYDIQIVREDGQIITELRLSTDGQGRIPETVIWYNIGVQPCEQFALDTLRSASGTTYDVGDLDYAGMDYALNILQDEELVRAATFRVAEGFRRPVLYAADPRGCPKSGFLIGEEDVWAVGKAFPKGAIIRLWAVPARSQWEDGDQLDDRTNQYGNGLAPVFELTDGENEFSKLLWPRRLTSIGSYDIVAEVVTYDIGSYHPSGTAQVRNVVSNLTYSGFVIQRRPGVAEPLAMDIAGSAQSPFTFRNTFLTTEDVYVGVDPSVQPSYVDQTADIYIVTDRTDAQWTVDPSLVDVTGVVETITVGGVCGNCWKTLAWSAPLTLGEYDVVLDFDRDGQYTPGLDLIDDLDPAGFIVSAVRVDVVSFNYGGSGAITLYDNINKSIINAPEYYSANHIVKPAAWVMGGSHSVQVEFRADPGVTSAEIWAENGFGGLNSSSTPVTVGFAGGTGVAIFSVNSVPSSIGKHLFAWDWKYKNLNGIPSVDLRMGETGEHLLYTVYSTPNAPMTTPWLEVLEYATDWASGQTTESGVVSAIVDGIYGSGMEYDGGQHHTYGPANFNLTAVFDELRTPGFTVFMDCRDCANLFHVLSNALGFNHQYLRIPGPFTYNPILAMGKASCSGGGWNYHQVGWCGSHVADASAQMDCTTLAVCDISAPDYIDLLTNTTGISAGATGLCSPY